MAWPDWTDELKDRYLADEGNLFLLTGDIDATWEVDGERLGAIALLVRFLSRTRQVVGVLRPGRALEFPNLGDRGRFDRLISASEVVRGRLFKKDVVESEAVLGLVHAALLGTGCDQAFIVADAHQIVPGHRKRVEPLGAGAPPLWAWQADLHGSNDIVLFLAPTVESVRSELAGATVQIALAAPAPEASARGTEPAAEYALRDAEAEIAAFLERTSAPPPVSTPTPSPAPVRRTEPREPTTEESASPSVDELAAGVVAALEVTLPLHPVATWTSCLPVMDAVARVLADYDDRLGLLELSVDEDGRPVARGLGADWFIERWRGDVALDAAAGMLLKDLPVAEGSAHFVGPAHPNETAVRALAKRLAKILHAR